MTTLLTCTLETLLNIILKQYGHIGTTTLQRKIRFMIKHLQKRSLMHLFCFSGKVSRSKRKFVLWN